MLAEQHRVGLRGIDDERDDDVALRAPSSAGVAQARPPSAANACSTVSRTCVHAQAGAQQRAGDAEAHRAEADDSNIS